MLLQRAFDRLVDIQRILGYPSQPNNSSALMAANSTATPRVEIIAYSYDLAPNPQKLRQFLAFFGIPYKNVEIRPIIPRPELAEIGITYRRSPLLSIDSDMYCDTALIISKLADMAQHSETGLADCVNHLEFNDLGQQAFKCASALIPPDSPFLTQEFLDDRSELRGTPFTREMLAKGRPQAISTMLVLVNLVESHHLRGDRRYFLGGEQPTTADMYAYWSFNWGLRFHEGARPEISAGTHPKIFAWLERVGSFVEARQRQPPISVEEAYAVLRAPPRHEYAKFVPHVKDNPEGLSEGDRVRVLPADSGRNWPQLGTLLGLNYEQICLRNDKGLVMHFPRTGYEISRAEG